MKKMILITLIATLNSFANTNISNLYNHPIKLFILQQMHTHISWLPSPPDTLVGTIAFSFHGNMVIIPVPFYAMGAEGVAAGPSMFTLHYYNTSNGKHVSSKNVSPYENKQLWGKIRQVTQNTVSNNIAIATLNNQGALTIEGQEKYLGQMFTLQAYDQPGKPDLAIHKNHLASLYQISPENYRADIWHLHDMLNVDRWFKNGWQTEHFDTNQLISLFNIIYEGIRKNEKVTPPEEEVALFQKIPTFVRKYLDDWVYTFKINKITY